MGKILLYLFLLSLVSTSVLASMNVSYVNTTVVLNKTTTARVVEQVLINITNSSVTQYLQDRQAINLTLSNWALVLHTTLLIQHIDNPNSSISNFTFLPGPIINHNAEGAQAYLTLSYTAYNITTIKNIGPRKFYYQFDSGALNFEHTASGESLPSNVRFNIIIPKGTSEVAVYPEPDYPYPNFVGTYTNVTTFSWYEGEPLSKFTFTYLVTQSLQDEVTTYFASAYQAYTKQIYLIIIILASILAVYIYTRVFV